MLELISRGTCQTGKKRCFRRGNEEKHLHSTINVLIFLLRFLFLLVQLDLVVVARVGDGSLEECSVVDWGIQMVVSTVTARLKEVERNQRWHGDIPKKNEADG
ncbi:hypothetical protein KFK09_003987 [Dendrobium nobile]|uniref:Uncharacterized protein n=1 Tax=Dendrobium nobile TaxID=94219 RepID=A0A8T3C2R5_DENNO|nr:hypothetical protein KFK09_003987 [Dendrobium nobile]